MKLEDKIEMNRGEEFFYDFLNNFELASMVLKIDSQVWIKTFNGKRRINFVITLINNQKIFIETDGEIHKRPEILKNDQLREKELSKLGINIIRFRFKDFFKNPEKVANRLEGFIDLLSAD